VDLGRRDRGSFVDSWPRSRGREMVVGNNHLLAMLALQELVGVVGVESYLAAGMAVVASVDIGDCWAARAAAQALVVAEAEAVERGRSRSEELVEEPGLGLVEVMEAVVVEVVQTSGAALGVDLLAVPGDLQAALEVVLLDEPEVPVPVASEVVPVVEGELALALGEGADPAAASVVVRWVVLAAVRPVAVLAVVAAGSVRGGHCCQASQEPAQALPD